MRLFQTTVARACAGLTLCLPLGFANAQAASDPCPRLPEGSGLTWQAMTQPGMSFCRALRADGSEAFTVMIAASTPFQPRRSDRAEKGSVDGRDVQWYRGEIAGDAQAQVRETLLEIGPGRVADISLRAQTPAQLQQALSQAQALRFDPEQARVSER